MSENIKIGDTEVRLIRDDLTLLDVDAFVFYARNNLALGSGYGSAIATRGGPSIKLELDKIGTAQPLQAIITTAGELKAKHIIHAVGPVFQEKDMEKKLKATIENTLKCADEHGITVLAFPLMGVGFYGISLDICFKVMIDSFNKYLSGKTGLKEVNICCNDSREYKFFAQKFSSLHS